MFLLRIMSLVHIMATAVTSIGDNDTYRQFRNVDDATFGVL